MTTRTITDEQIERLGKIVGRAAQFRYFFPKIDDEARQRGFREIEDEAAALYRELGGEE